MTDSRMRAFRDRVGGLAYGGDCDLEQWDPAVWREDAANITTRPAGRYSHHPALAMWRISDEYGPTAYNEAASAGFRRRLRRRYGDLAMLDDAWTRTGGPRTSARRAAPRRRPTRTGCSGDAPRSSRTPTERAGSSTSLPRSSGRRSTGRCSRRWRGRA